MAYPKLRVPYASRQMVDVFKGYNHNLRIGDGEFYDMKNLTSDDYPVLSSRQVRGVFTVAEKPLGLIAKDALCYVDGKEFVMNDYRIDMELNDEPKQLVSMGAYVVIFPDKKYINTQDVTDRGSLDNKVVTKEKVTFSLCRADGSACNGEYVGDTAPEEPEDNMTWIDTSSEPYAFKQWSESAGMWVQIATTYVKIASVGIDEGFSVYDGIHISGLADQTLHTETGDEIMDTTQLAALEGQAVIWDKGEGYIVVVGILSGTWTITDAITIERRMPLVDFVIESGNRLWGCRYGPAANGEVVNEIYCSKLGDFKNWNCFMGISTDSWVGSVGTDGPFTGAVAHLGHPLFFKENHLHKIYTSSTAAHQMADTPCRGVQQGCARSLAIVGEVLYYKGRSGVCAYDGSLPVEISQALGSVQYGNAVAGGYGSKYVVSMDDPEGNHHLFVYDTAKAMWHREDELRADFFCNCRGELYCLETGSGKIWTLCSAGNQAEPDVEWMAETGMIGLAMPDMKYISRLTMRMTLPRGSQMSCYAEYDSSGRWEKLFTLAGQGTKAFTIPVRPVRCDHMRLRLEGTGEMKLFSITKTIEQGSDVR